MFLLYWLMLQTKAPHGQSPSLPYLLHLIKKNICFLVLTTSPDSFLTAVHAWLSLLTSTLKEVTQLLLEKDKEGWNYFSTAKIDCKFCLVIKHVRLLAMEIPLGTAISTLRWKKWHVNLDLADDQKILVNRSREKPKSVFWNSRTWENTALLEGPLILKEKHHHIMYIHSDVQKSYLYSYTTFIISAAVIRELRKK